MLSAFCAKILGLDMHVYKTLGSTYLLLNFNFTLSSKSLCERIRYDVYYLVTHMNL